MAPMQHLVAKFYLIQKNIKTTLWFTHSGPKFGIKWLILWFSSLLANNIVTASKHSFPFRFKKVKCIGHGINFDNFFIERKTFQFEKVGSFKDLYLIKLISRNSK